MNPYVLAVHCSAMHSFSKSSRETITLLAGLGVEGDAHCGATVKHRSHVIRNAAQPNLRQVHLIQAELFAALDRLGFRVRPGQIGENISTSGIDLLGLGTGTELLLGDEAVVRITGLRSPCAQLDKFQSGLKSALLDRTPEGVIIRKAGVMGVVVKGGQVSAYSPINIKRRPERFEPLQLV